MTARQIIQAIETLSPEDRSEVKTFLLQEEKVSYGVRYADPDKAMAVANKIFADRAELFQKLAQ